MKNEDKIRRKVEVGCFVISGIIKNLWKIKDMSSVKREDTEENGGVERENTSTRKNIR